MYLQYNKEADLIAIPQEGFQKNSYSMHYDFLKVFSFCIIALSDLR